MTNEEKITKLTAMWYSCLIDHHKDRDCHFQIVKKWSYGKPPVYCVEHYGYIYEEINDQFDTIEEAEIFLINTLKEMVEIEAKQWLETAKEEDDWNNKIAKNYKQRFEQILEDLNGINLS